MKKVGLFSGTFDPVHDGHLNLAKAAIDQAGLDKVFFMVEPRPRRKQGVKAYEHRLKMLRLAISKEPKFGVIILEHDRFSVHDTLPPLEARFKNAEIFLLLGDDILKHLPTWSGIEDLLGKVQLIVMPRKLTKKQIEMIINDHQKRDNLPYNYTILANSLSKVSSSVLRRQLRAGQKPLNLPNPVYNYVQTHGLYATDASASS